MPPEHAATPRGRRGPKLPAWMRRHAPTDGSIELAIIVGVYVPSKAHELYDGRAGFRRFAPASAAVGLRIDYFALSWVGFELEGVAMPTRARGGGRALVSGFRGGLALRPPWRLTPVLSGGVGVLAVTSQERVVGDDYDPSFHLGGGLQYFATRHLALRIDARDNITNRRAVGGRPTHHPEVLLAITGRFGPRAPAHDRPLPPTVPVDHDGDRIADAFDHCPRHAGPTPDGCPRSDRDDDGFIDDADGCPDVFGQPPTGCPTPIDEDGDGLVGDADLCPAIRGTSVDGCPVVVPERPTTEIGPELAELEGVLSGVTFDNGKDTLTPAGRATLSRVADALQSNPGVRVELVGHTDDRGSESVNRSLSERRARTVMQALVDRGVAADRLRARGAGGDEPIASNATAAGRATNRRVELIVLRD